MFFIKSGAKNFTTSSDVKAFVFHLSFWQPANLLMSAYYLDNP
jgi:hypothetical protein